MGNIQKLRFAGVLFGAALVYGAFSELSLGRGTDGEPKTITCAELGDFGSRANPFIEMTEFLLCEQGYIYKEEHGKWQAVWIPAVGCLVRRQLPLMMLRTAPTTGSAIYHTAVAVEQSRESESDPQRKSRCHIICI